ncbi:HipA N-terminal domain-containing protein [Escherichia coli]|nr:HipA N-terminal domain-containing protein [Escherichia coli]
MPKLVTWMNNQRVGELTKLANGAHTFKYAPEWLASRYARPLSLSLPLQRGNITSDAVFNFFDNLLPDSPIVRDRIVKRYHAKSRQPFDLLSEIGRDSVGAVTLLPENETITRPIMAWEKLTEARLEEVLTAYKADIPLGMIREENDFRISVAGAQEKTALLRIGNDWCIPKGITPTTHIIKLPIGEIRFPEVQMHEILSDFARMIPAALDNVKTSLPTDFPENVVTAVETNVLRLHGRLSREYGSK